MSEFKDTMGRWLTQALFWEYRHKNYQALFTFKDDDFVHDGVLFKSLKKLYLQIEDPTEYLFATTVLGGWEHWQKMCGTKLIFPHIQKWRDELDIKLKAKALRAVLSIAESPENKGQLSAAKYMAEKGWESKRGRPTKEELVRRQKIDAKVTDEIEEDYVRILGEVGTHK